MDIDHIRKAMKRPLPGIKAQKVMASEERLFGPVKDGVRQAAVLILFYPGDDGLHFLLTVRRDDLTHHPGQVSLPGGGLDDGEAAEDAALREAREELGIAAERVELLGRLTSLCVHASGNVVQPVVGYASERPSMTPNPTEVAEVLEIPLNSLLDAGAVKEGEVRAGEDVLTVPYYDLGGRMVWGATAIVLAELVALLRGQDGERHL